MVVHIVRMFLSLSCSETNPAFEVFNQRFSFDYGDMSYMYAKVSSFRTLRSVYCFVLRFGYRFLHTLLQFPWEKVPYKTRNLCISTVFIPWIASVFTYFSFSQCGKMSFVCAATATLHCYCEKVQQQSFLAESPGCWLLHVPPQQRNVKQCFQIDWAPKHEPAWISQPITVW